jgi:hypothetical protein
MVKPYELYVRFLVTKGCDELELVNTALTDLTLQPITQEDLDRHYNLIHDTLPDPVSRQLLDKRYEGDFLQWMGVLDVRGMWLLEKPYRNPDDGNLRLVYDVHHDIKLRMSLNALLLKGAAAPDICQSLNTKFSYMLKPAHVDLYAKYFWDHRRMTRTLWRSYLAGASEAERSILFVALSEPLDVIKTLLDLPSKSNISDSLQYLFASAYQKARHYLRLSSKESNAEARAWITTSIALADKYEKHRTGDLEDFSKSLQMEFEFVDSEFPTPDATAMAELQRGTQEAKPQWKT